MELSYTNGSMFFDFHSISKGFDTEDEYNNLYTENFFLTEIQVKGFFLTITQKQRHLDIYYIKWNNFMATKRLFVHKIGLKQWHVPHGWQN